MKKGTFLLTLLLGMLFSAPMRADEGMWLLQLLKEQHTIDLMKQAGLELEADDIYKPNGVALKDAVGIFGGGCTGEVISSEGLILTNHHCGYSSLQQLSTVENDYLKDGFWARSRQEELPVPGLTFTFVAHIEDLTAEVERDIASGEVDELTALFPQYLDGVASTWFEKSDYKDKEGYYAELLPYFAGNKYYAVVYRIYTDIRMVCAPPSSIGKFGGETDNWMWPRHTGDFALFRIYADTEGNPTEAYSEDNIPLKPEKHLHISLQGYEEGDYAMIIGFPGSTDRYLTAAEVHDRVENENTPRIAVRAARQEVLKKYMSASDSIRIMYANKYAASSNYWKNSIGMNEAIGKNNIIEKKLLQEAQFMLYADSMGNQDYRSVVEQINEVVTEGSRANYDVTLFSEVFFSGLEFSLLRRGSNGGLLLDILTEVAETNRKLTEEEITIIRDVYDRIHNKDYSHEVDRAVAHELIFLYYDLSKENTVLPAFYQTIIDKYKGTTSRYVDALYDNSIFSSRKNLEAFLRKPTAKALLKDPFYNHFTSLMEKRNALYDEISQKTYQLMTLQKTYVRGLTEMNGRTRPQYSDANFTMRLTYGNIRPYAPADGITYHSYTTLNGVLEKEDPTSDEFIVPPVLKTLALQKDYGRYANALGELPVCFLMTGDITGGNSGSPVLDSKGRLIGTAFDGNWESLSGDIEYDLEKQRSICVDIRYILFVIDKFGDCQNIIDELTIEQ